MLVYARHAMRRCRVQAEQSNGFVTTSCASGSHAFFIHICCCHRLRAAAMIVLAAPVSPASSAKSEHGAEKGTAQKGSATRDPLAFRPPK